MGDLLLEFLIDWNKARELRLPEDEGYVVGWSDLPLFAIFENRHIAEDQVYFLWIQFQTIGKFRHARLRRTRGQVFILKNHRDLKNVFFLLELWSYNNLAQHDMVIFFS